MSARGSIYTEDNTNNRNDINSYLYNSIEDNNEIYISIIAEYLKYIIPNDEVKFYFGIGPQIYFNIYNKQTDKIQTNSTSYTIIKRVDDRYRIGLTSSLGVEWLFRKNMSLHAEYGFFVFYLYEKYEDHKRSSSGSTDEIIRKQNGLGFDDEGALMGLSIYF